MYQNSQRGSKIFTPIFPSAVSTQILSSQNNVAPALQLSQPVMAPQTFASQAVVPQVQSVAVPQVQSVAIPQVQSVVPQVQSVVPQVQSVVPQVQSVVPQVQSIVPQVQSVVPTPIAQAPTLVPYIMPSGSRMPMAQNHMGQNLNTNFNNIGGSIYGRITMIR